MSENTSKQILLPGYNTILGHILYKFKDLLDINNSIDGFEDITSQKINDKFFLEIDSNSNSGVLTTQELTKISSNVEGAPTEKYFIKLGTLFRIFQDLIYLSDKNKPLSTFDFDYDNNFCFNPANKLISLDTNVCVVPSETFQSQNNLIDKINNDFTDTNGERKDLGNTMHILLNIDMLLNTLNNTTNNEISIYNFMSSVLTNVNNSFANVTDLSFIYDVDTNTYHIIDENLPGNTNPPSKINVGILNSQQGMENGSFVKNISLNSQLSPNLASQIAIGAQATTGTSKIPQESLAFSSWNTGATDRIVGTKISPKINTSNEDEKMTEEDFQSLNDFLNDQQYWSPQSTDYVSSFLPIYKKYISTEFKEQIFSSFIPINLAMEMEGLSGMRIYQKYSITEQYLPKIYKDKIEFLIKGISHTINTKEWNTTIDGLSIPKISKDLIPSNQKSPTQQTSNNKVQQSDDNVDTPNADALRSVLEILGYKEKEAGREYKGGPIVEGPQLSNGGDITLKLKNYADSVFRKIKELYPAIQITVTGGNDLFHQNLNSASSHKSGNGLDFTISPNNQENRNKVEKIVLGYVVQNPNIWVINEYNNPSISSTGGHFHIRIGRDKSGADRIAEAREQAERNELITYSLT